MSANEKGLSIVVAAVASGPRLFEKLNGTEALYAVERCLKRMTRGIDGFHGRIVRSTRDEIVAVFATPDEACQAAIAMQRRLGDLPPVGGIKLAARVGVHHGRVIDDGNDVVGHGIGVAEALSGLATAGQILIGGETWEKLSPHLQSLTHGLAKVWLQSLAAEQSVYEVHWLESRSPATQAATDSSTPNNQKKQRLRVSYGNRTIVLENKEDSVVIGRDTASQIAVRDRRVSRQHARIERVGDYFVLSDLSTNGTFVTLEGEPELLLKREEFILRGSGIIAFAASANHPATDVVEFELF